MKKYIKFLTCILIICFSFLLVTNVIAIDTGLDTTGNIGYENFGGDAVGKSDLAATIGRIIGAGLMFIGLLFLVLMIYGGFLWMTARGNEEQVTRAKELIVQACFGLIIVVSAYLTTRYIGETVINSFLGYYEEETFMPLPS